VSSEAKEPVNFRLGRSYKQALQKLAREQDKAVGELIREVVEEYVADQERAAWEAEARRTALELGRAARDPRSDEAEMLRILDANLEAFAGEWVWEEDGG
jgi:predicted DNA-binding protein